jgi:cytochrome c-type biogenesis protein CcmH/NrfG
LLDAVEALRRALRLDPRFAEARFALAQILAESNELALAAAELETLLSFEPGHVEAQRELRNIRRRTSAAG